MATILTVRGLEGSTITTRAKLSSPIGTTATLIMSVDANRIVESVENQDGETFWVGDANVTTDEGGFPGEMVPPGSSYPHRSSAALYAVCKSGDISKIARNYRA